MKISRFHLANIFIGILFMLVLSNANYANAQCNLNMESKIEKIGQGPNSDIQIRLNRGEGTIDLYLIDLNNPQRGPIQKATKSASELRNEYVVVFRNVPPSKYTIQAIDNRKCQISIGGVEGIIISSN